MLNSVGLSNTVTGAQTKENLIQQAHEARQLRELTRKQEHAALRIQSFLKSIHVRRTLKLEAASKLETYNKSVNLPPPEELLATFREVLFFCDAKQDRHVIDTAILYLLNRAHKTREDITVPSENGNGTCKSLLEDALMESAQTIAILANDTSVNSCSAGVEPTNNLIRDLIVDSSRSSGNLDQWVHVIGKLVNLCIHYLEDINSSLLDSQHISSYLRVIALFNTKEVMLEAYNLSDGTSTTTTIEIGQVVSTLADRIFGLTLEKSSGFLLCCSNLVFNRINRFRNDLKSTILKSFSCILVRLLRLDQPALDQDESPKLQIASQLIGTLAIPGLLTKLQKHCPEALSCIVQQPFYNLTIRSLNDDRAMASFNSTAFVCILGNLIQLISFDLKYSEQHLGSLISVITKLLESCQKNMLQASNGPNGLPLGKASKKNEVRDVSFHPILGWLCREQVTTVDKELICSQLGCLWTRRMLEIFFTDLIKHNERIANINRANSGASLKGSTGPLATFRLARPENRNSASRTTASQEGPSPTFINLTAIRKAMERATTTVTRSISSSYNKTATSGRTSGNSKLMTPEAARIASVCQMFHMCQNILTTLKQDILTGLCLHDFILHNLWAYISSLGPKNGMNAFLDHLSYLTKTSAPEFYILTLFCECTSYLVNILDDSELYEKQRPFKLEELVEISNFLNQFIFRIICNNLVAESARDSDPVFQGAYKLLLDLYKRDCRKNFAPQDHWLIKDLKMSAFLKDLDQGKPIAKSIMKLMPHIIPHKERVIIFRRLVARDKARHMPSTFTYITIHRSRIVEDGYQRLSGLPSQALKAPIRVVFVNDHGLDEAGLDQDGVFKEFLEDTIKKVFDPAFNLFSSTSEQRLYPSPTSRLHEDHLSLFTFVGKMIGKALYEGIVVDVPFATFFLSRVLGQPQSPLYSPIDELPSLDPELYKSLTYIKHYDGDVADLDLTFSIDQDFMGKIETFELELGGKSIPVTKESRVRYIHSIANFRVKTQTEKQTEAFISGFKSIIDINWLKMFSACEFQRLISGDNTPIDLQDLKRHTKYFGGFHGSHRVVLWLWDILEKDFTPEEHKLFLKFVTSCSKPPLLGFANLEPPFSIRCVEVSDDQDSGDTMGSVLRGFFAIRRSDPVDRLPTSSTCFNVLKLPNYQRRSTLREKLRYAILSNAGFELS